MPEIICIARTGDDAPDGNGTFREFIWDPLHTSSGQKYYYPYAPILNCEGEVAFYASLDDTRFGWEDGSGYFRGSASGPVIQIVRAGQPLPGSTDTVGGRFGTNFGLAALNSRGQIAFASSVTDDSGRQKMEILRGNGGPLELISSEMDWSLAGINSEGDVTFVLLEDSSIWPYHYVVYRCSSALSCTQIAATGDSPGDRGLVFRGLSAYDINVAGDVLFSAFLADDLENPPDYERIQEALYVGSGLGSPHLIARTGQEAPDGSVIHRIATVSSLATSSMVAFLIYDSRLIGHTTAVLRKSGDALTQIAVHGQAAPDGNGIFESFRGPRINGVGQVAFWAQLAETRGETDDSRGIYSGMGHELIQIVRAGQSTPEGIGRFSLDMEWDLDCDPSPCEPYDEPAGNDPISRNNYPLALAIGGQVAFFSKLSGGGEGIYIGDGTDLVKVVRTGDELDGREVSRLFFSFSDTNSRQAFNAHCQVAFIAEFTDGTQGVYLYTRDIHLGQEIDVPELLDADWELNIPPEEVHNVFIDPDKDIKVRIAEKEVAVKQLTIGGGKGTTTVSLKDGKVLAAEGVDVAFNGVLTGSGIIDGDVENQGEINPKRIDVKGDVKNKGIICGESEDDSMHVSGTMSNEGEIEGSMSVGSVFENLHKGRVRLSKGDKMRFCSSENINWGLISVDGGKIKIRGNLKNSTHGRIMASEAKLVFNGRLFNTGLLAGKFTRVQGDIINRHTGKLFTCGEMVYNGDVINYGIINTDVRSKSIFNGLLSGTGQLTGQGKTVIEGALKPSAGQGITVEGCLVLGDKSKTQLVLNQNMSAAIIDVRSVLRLGGVLEVVVAKNFKTSTDDVIVLFRASEIEGEFQEIVLPKIDGFYLKLLCSRFRCSLLFSAH